MKKASHPRTRKGWDGETMFKFNIRMASEVPTNELYALVTCELFCVAFKRFLTLTVQKMQLTIKVSNKLFMNFSLTVCCIKLYLKGHI